MLEDIDLKIGETTGSEVMDETEYPTTTAGCFTKFKCTPVNPC